MNKPTFKHICLMHIQQLTNFPYIEKDFDALTDYGLLCKVVDYLNQVIANENAQNDNIVALYNAFTELKNYVESFFDNLDVQEEINNKLDDMVEDGTLDEIISRYINDNVHLIFPKFWDNASSGDCNLIKYDNKILMIDTYNSYAWSNVRTMLIDNDIEHLDYLIITHYHGDHYGNLENLIAYNYIDENTIVYLPADTTYLDGTNGTENVAERIIQVKALLTSNNIDYIVPEEYSELNIKDLKIVFFNCDADNLKSYYYDNGIKDYNQYSTVNLMYHKNIKYLYMGDGGPSTYQRLLDTNFITGRIDLFKLGHHGHNTSTNIKFMNLIQPTYTIQLSGSDDFIKNNFSITNDIPVLKNNGSKIYPTNMQPTYLYFKCDGEHINCVDGYEYSLSNNLEVINLYVNKNASTSNIQDGTQSHPFTEIIQALGIIKTYPQYNYNIRIAAGEYGLAHPTDNKKRRVYITTGKSSFVRLIGTGETNESVTLSDVIINNSSVILENLTVDVDNLSTQDAVTINNSNVVFNNVNIKSMTGTSKNVKALTSNYNSNIKINSLFIDDVTTGLHTTHSSLIAYSLHFGDNISGDLVNQYNCEIITRTVTIDDSTKASTFTDNYKLVKSPQLLFSSSEGATSDINFSKDISLFNWIEIYFTTDNGIKGNSGKIYNTVGNMVGLSAFYTHSGGTTYNKQCNCAIASDHLTLSVPKQIVISSSGCHSADLTGAIKVLRVIGGFTEY